MRRAASRLITSPPGDSKPRHNHAALGLPNPDKKMKINPESFLGGYLECALWTSEHDEATIFDFDPESSAEAQDICSQFEAEQAEALERYYDKTGRTESSAGHDLWLTRNGHGAGFWDRISDDDFPELCEAAKALGECYVFAHDAGSLYGIE